jgi:hypothetical protein
MSFDTLDFYPNNGSLEAFLGMQLITLQRNSITSLYDSIQSSGVVLPMLPEFRQLEKIVRDLLCGCVLSCHNTGGEEALKQAQTAFVIGKVAAEATFAQHCVDMNKMRKRRLVERIFYVLSEGLKDESDTDGDAQRLYSMVTSLKQVIISKHPEIASSHNKLTTETQLP